MQNRFRSKLMWAAVAAQVGTVLILTKVVSVSEAETINQIVAAGLQILTLVGVLNNPTDKGAF